MFNFLKGKTMNEENTTQSVDEQVGTSATSGGVETQGTGIAVDPAFVPRATIPGGDATNELTLPVNETGTEEKMMAHIRGYMRAANIRFVVGAYPHIEEALHALAKACNHLADHVAKVVAEKEAA